jgi:hypothetical protein
LQPTIFYQSVLELEDLSGVGTHQRGLALVNARAEWSPTEWFTLAALVNLFQKHYYGAGNNVYEPIGFA